MKVLVAIGWAVGRNEQEQGSSVGGGLEGGGRGGVRGAGFGNWTQI